MKKIVKNKLIVILAVLTLLSSALFCAFGVYADSSDSAPAYKKFFTASDGVTVEYKQKSDLPYSDLGDGIRVVMKDYTEVAFNKTIDLSLNSVKDSFLNFYVIPSVDGQADFTEMFVYLYDVNDANNYVKIRLKDATTVIYSQAGANGNALKGLAHWDGKIYTDGLWGGAEEASFKGYYKSGDRRMVKLKFDNEIMQYFINGRFIVDLDDPQFYSYSQHFKGFSSNQVNVKLVVNGTNKQRAELVITKLGDLTGAALNATEIVDTEAPVITVDKSSYGVVDFPNPVIGGTYPLFDYSACDVEDGFCDVDVKVVRNGNQLVAIKNGAFTVDVAGEYTITYSTTDSLNNKAEIVKTFVAGADKTAISVDIERNLVKTSMSVGEKITLPKILNVAGAVGNFSTSIQAISKTKSYVITDGVFAPEEAGTYSIVFGAKDILNRFGNVVYEIEVEVADKAIFIETPNLPKYFIEGFEYNMPSIKAFNYASGSSVNVSTAVSVDGGEATILGADGKIKLSCAKEKSTVVITYTADGQTVSYERPLIKVRDSLNQINMYKYFVSTGITVSADNDNTILSTTTDGSVEFINALLASDLKVVFNAIENKTNFKKLTFTFTDSVNKKEKLSVLIENNGEQSIMKLGNNSVVLSSKLSDVTSNVNLLLNNDVTIGDKNLRIFTYDNGEEYQGFSSGLVYMTVAMDGVFAESEIAIKTINNQNMGAKTVRDNIKPRVVITGDIGGMYNKGETVTTLKGFAADVISPNVDFTLTVESPSGNVVYDVNGLKLENVSPYKQYDFILEEKGDYNVYYTATDSFSRSASSMYIIRSYVEQYMSFNQNEITVKAGASISIPKPTLNNVDNASDYKTTVILFNADGDMTRYESLNKKIKFNKKGNYRLVYVSTAINELGKIDSSTSLVGSIDITVE